MSVKKDTKEKFTVYTPSCNELSANMAEELLCMIREGMTAEPPHVIVNLQSLDKADSSTIEKLLSLQNESYEKNISFVICGVSKKLEPHFSKSINSVPTESEAWDIVQMEEIERELLDHPDESSK